MYCRVLVVERALRQFDAEGPLLRWPSRADAIELALWVLWSRLPWNKALDERAISALLDCWHVFGDHALLCRALFDFGFVDRTIDGREYRRLPRTMPPEAIELLHRLKAN